MALADVIDEDLVGTDDVKNPKLVWLALAEACLDATD